MLLCMHNKVHTLHAHMPDPGGGGRVTLQVGSCKGEGTCWGIGSPGGRGGWVVLFWNEQFEGIFKTALGYSS
jgi:hypothetical protein